jgi:NAD+ diphosphatase
VRIWDEPPRLDRLGRETRSDEAAVARLWADGRLMTLGDGPSLEVEPPLARADTWSGGGRWPAQAARPERGRVTLASRSTVGRAHDPEAHLLLGLVDGQAWFADRLGTNVGCDLREALPLLSAAQAELAVTAVALANWHWAEGFCPRCGSATRIAAAGLSRWCAGCDNELFPRTDPAVIVAVVDDCDRILLARQRIWPSDRYSVIAGFVEAGESLEQAVQREVAEEVGVQVDRVAYVSSQPWPMPRSLMLGLTAHAAKTTVTPDGAEIADARWFTRDEAATAVESGELVLPGPASIAFRLISAWLDRGGTPPA